MKSGVRLFDNSFWGGVSAVFKMVSSIIVVFILIELMGASSFGIVTVLTTITTIWLIINSGFYLILVRRLIHTRNHDEIGVANLILAGLLFTLSSILALYILYSAFNEALSGRLYIGQNMPISYSEFTDAFEIAVIAVMLRIIIDYMYALFEGEGRFSTAAKLQLCSPALLLTITVLYVVLNYSLTVREYFLILLVSVLAELLVSVVILVRTRTVFLASKGSVVRSLKLMKPLLSESARLQAANMFSLFVDPLNKLMLHGIIGPAAVTSYEVATRIANAMRGVFSAAFRSFMQISPDMENAKDKYAKLIGYIFLPALIMHFMVLVLLTEMISSKFIDIPFDTVYMLLLVLPISMAIVVVSPLYSLLLGIGDLKYILLLHFRLAVFNATGALILIPILGVIGSGIALAIVTLYNAYSIYQRTNNKHIALPNFGSLIKNHIVTTVIVLALTMLSMYSSLQFGVPWSALVILSVLIIMLRMFWQEPLINKLMKTRLLNMLRS